MTKLISVLLFLPLLANAQSNLPPQIADSLWNIWQDETQPDTTRLGAINNYIWNGYLFTQPDSAFYYSQLEYNFAHSKGLKKQMADALNGQGISFAIRGNYDRAIDHFIKSLKIKEDVGDQKGVANLLNNVGIIYEDQGDYERAIDNYLQSLKIQEELDNMRGVSNSLNNIGNCYYNQDEFLKAIDYHTRSLNIKEQTGDKNGIAISLNNLGLVYNKQGEFAKALETFNRSLKIKEEFGDKQSISNTLNNIGGVYMSEGDYKSAMEYSRRAFTLAREVGAVIQTRDAANSLWKVHKKLSNYKPSLEMYELYIELRDSVLSEENEKEVIRQEYQYAYEKQAAADSVAIAKATEITNAHIAQQQAELKAKKNQQYGLFIGLVLMFILAASAYYRFQSKKKANKVLQKTLANLKSTQSLLIQSEKMASLGELTAGIAHEIQNPLNFVNNFSELNSELITELKVELAKGNLSEVKAIATDLSENEGKINHHGKRAESIVKGMLAHSRKSEGAKESINVNALADEYLRLSYHGLRAQNKSLNAEIKTDFDGSIGKIDVIPQDIGRVLLNLFNNAFYAVQEKTKEAKSDFEPVVSVITKRVGNHIEIRVSDNGNGIPHKIRDKIFQPFFTTKPTGQGTGLGLSLSYDIVKAHEGELRVETEIGKGTTFIVELPVS